MDDPEQRQQQHEENLPTPQPSPVPPSSDPQQPNPSNETEQEQSQTTTSQQAEHLPNLANTALETALRQALASQDLGRLCKKLGDEYCLPHRAPRAAGCADNECDSDTTAPVHLDQGSTNDSGVVKSVGAGGQDAAEGGSTKGSGKDESGDDGAGEAVGVVGSNVDNLAVAVGIPADLLDSAWKALFAWREALAEGTLLDVFNTLEGEWYLGKVLSTEDNDGPSAIQSTEDGGREGEEARTAQAKDRGKTGDHVRIHYQGWPNKYDETFARGSSSLQPVHTYTKRPKKPERKKKRVVEALEWVRTDDMGNIVARGIVGEDDPYEDPGQAEKKIAAALQAEGVATNRYGRKLVTQVELATPKSKAKGAAKTPEGTGERGQGSSDGASGEGARGDGESVEGSSGADGSGSRVKKTKNRYEGMDS